MIETIISNNCTGGAIMHQLGMEFKTPTVNLQILPEEFPTFCRYLKYYMKQDLVEYKDINSKHEIYLRHMFGGVPNMPYGMLGDIIVCFQHYDTFAESKEKWDERKARIDYDHIGYIFHARDDGYLYEAINFLELNLPNSVIITEGFTLPKVVALDTTDGKNAFTACGDHPYITEVMDFKAWREQA